VKIARCRCDVFQIRSLIAKSVDNFVGKLSVKGLQAAAGLACDGLMTFQAIKNQVKSMTYTVLPHDQRCCQYQYLKYLFLWNIFLFNPVETRMFIDV